MKSSQPPSLATWLLEHLLPSGGNEPLAGDLSEGYSQGRSAVWYWRQVLVAIMAGFSKELRARWVMLMFAAIVSSALPWKHIWHSSDFQFVIVWGTRLPWPASFFFSVAFLSVFEAVVLLVAVSVYLRAIRSFNLRSFSKGPSIALLILIFGNIGVMSLSVTQLSPLLFYYVVWRLPLFFGLVLAMWVARPSVAGGQATRLPA
jgi:hypothetical protein